MKKKKTGSQFYSPQVNIQDFGEKCGGTGCGMMHGCSDRHCDQSKSDCKECIKDADDALAQIEKDMWKNMGA